MTHFYSTYAPEWETTAEGWRSVVSPSLNDGQWLAYVETSDHDTCRIWAGTAFSSVQDAQEWCKIEIARQVERSTHSHPAGENNGTWVWGNVESMHNNEFMAY